MNNKQRSQDTLNLIAWYKKYTHWQQQGPFFQAQENTPTDQLPENPPAPKIHSIDWEKYLSWLQEQLPAGESSGCFSPNLSGFLRADFHIYNENLITLINEFAEIETSRTVANLVGNDWIGLFIQFEGDIQRKRRSSHQKDHSLSLSCRFINCTLSYKAELAPKTPYSSIAILTTKHYLQQKIPTASQLLLETFKKNDHQKEVAFLPISVTPELQRFSRELFKLSKEKPHYMLLSEALSMATLAEAIGSLNQSDQKTVEQFSLRAKDIELLHSLKKHIDNNYCTPISAVDLSLSFGLNRNKMTNGFRVLFGMTVKEYQVMLRMEHAKQLLEGKVSVGDVAEAVGYSDQSSFSRAFKQYYDALPKEFLRALYQK